MAGLMIAMQLFWFCILLFINKSNTSINI
jgi:hypothetical protein